MFKLRAIVVGSVLLGCQGAKQEQNTELLTVSKPQPASSSLPVTHGKHKLLLLSREGDTVVITAQRTVDEPLNPHPRRIGGKAWSYDALDEHGTVLHRDNLIQPGLVRGEFKNSKGAADSPPDHVEVELEGPHHLEIRVPLNTHQVNFYVRTVNHRGGRILRTLLIDDEVHQ